MTARDIVEDAGDLRGMVSAMRLLGDTYRTLGRLDEAAAALERGLELAERVGSLEEIGGCLSISGSSSTSGAGFRSPRRHPAGRSQNSSASDMARAAPRATRTSPGPLWHVDEDDEALAYARRAIDVGSSIGHPIAVADATDTIAHVAQGRGEFREAATAAEQAATIYAEAGAVPQARGSFLVAAEAWQKLGEEDRARAANDRARSLAVA